MELPHLKSERQLPEGWKSLTFDGRGAPYEESLLEASSLAQKHGVIVDGAFVNPVDFRRLGNFMGLSKAQVSEEGVIILRMATYYGMVDIYEDANCPRGESWMLRLRDRANGIVHVTF